MNNEQSCKDPKKHGCGLPQKPLEMVCPYCDYKILFTEETRLETEFKIDKHAKNDCKSVQ